MGFVLVNNHNFNMIHISHHLGKHCAQNTTPIHTRYVEIKSLTSLMCVDLSSAMNNESSQSHLNIKHFDECFG